MTVRSTEETVAHPYLILDQLGARSSAMTYKARSSNVTTTESSCHSEVFRLLYYRYRQG